MCGLLRKDSPKEKPRRLGGACGAGDGKRAWGETGFPWIRIEGGSIRIAGGVASTVCIDYGLSLKVP
jgi:hypothetical protein